MLKWKVFQCNQFFKKRGIIERCWVYIKSSLFPLKKNCSLVVDSCPLLNFAITTSKFYGEIFCEDICLHYCGRKLSCFSSATSSFNIILYWFLLNVFGPLKFQWELHHFPWIFKSTLLLWTRHYIMEFLVGHEK